MHFCTISTHDHAYKVFALCESLRLVNPAFTLHALFVDKMPDSRPHAQLSLYTLDAVNDAELGNDIIEKYKSKSDKLRWSLKPVFLKKLLLSQSLEAVIYLDNDLCFFEDYAFLFALLKQHSFLLTPHHYERSPYHQQNMLEANFRVGLYNAGFVGANKEAIQTLDWWASCCLYRCEKNALRGTFDDQKYLDLIPVMDEKAHIVRHQGCNVAEWNEAVLPRTMREGKVYINETYPVVFIHFNHTTIRAIMQGREALLKPFFETYFQFLIKYNAMLKKENLFKSPALIDYIKYSIWRVLTRFGF